MKLIEQILEIPDAYLLVQKVKVDQPACLNYRRINDLIGFSEGITDDLGDEIR
jgi:hypothetical protein